MRRMIALLKRDMISTTKDYILIYALVAPILMALGFRLFLPSVGQISINAVVLESTDPALVTKLEGYMNVDLVANRAAMERRVVAFDDTVGILVESPGSYTLVTEGNETHDSLVLPQMILTQLAGGPALTYSEEIVGGDRFPFRAVVGAFMTLAVGFIAAMVMGFHIIEDKESAMMSALGVSPLNRREYIGTRAITVVTVSVILVFGSLWTLGLTAFDYLQVLAIALVSSLIAVVLGFLIGALSANQIAGVANVKFGVLLMMAPAFFALLAPAKYHFAMWWVPTFWSFVSLRDVLTTGLTWSALAPMLLWNLLTSLVWLGVSYPFLKGRLDFARE